MKIPYFRYDFLYKEYQKEIDNALEKVLGKGAFILQEELKEFENAIADFVGAKYAIGVGNGTDSLILMLKACGIGLGDEVILSSHTFVATASAVNWVGAIPVLIDCGDDHLMDVDSIEAMIGPKTKAIMPTQLNGRTCNMEKMCAVAKRHGLLILEDAAQALGSKFNNRCAGTWGKAGSISFYPAKVLGCFGDGGIVFTNDTELNFKLRCLRDHGRDPLSNEIKTWGINSRLDNLNAAILLAKFRNYTNTVNRRREIAQKYNDYLASIKEIILPPAPNADKLHFDIYQNYEIEAENRDKLKQHLQENGVGTLIQWGGKALHQIGAIAKDMRFDKLKLGRTELLFKRCLMLPMNTSLLDDEVSYICEKIEEFYR